MKLNVFPTTNIESVLLRVRNRKTNYNPVEIQLHERIQKFSAKPVNQFDFDQLETEKIFHIDQIKTVCIDYRLRFLDLNYFKGDFPESALDAIKHLEKVHKTKLGDLKIMAPSVLFRLNKTDDPLLFAPMGNKYYYLVHKWGNDLHPFRQLWVWPFKGIWHLMALIVVLSAVVTVLTPLQIFTKTPDASTFWLLFFFMFKAIASVVLFYGFALGKNFNPAIWNNKYNKA